MAYPPFKIFWTVCSDDKFSDVKVKSLRALPNREKLQVYKLASKVTLFELTHGTGRESMG